MKSPWEYATLDSSEHSHQVALFMWAAIARRYGKAASCLDDSYSRQGYAQKFTEDEFWQDDRIPELAWLHAIHNQGHGDAIRGSKAKAEGVRAGVADLFLPVRMYDGFHPVKPPCVGLYIELKRPALQREGLKACSPEQLEFKAFAEAQGYRWELAFSWLEARDAILRYLGRD